MPVRKGLRKKDDATPEPPSARPPPPPGRSNSSDPKTALKKKKRREHDRRVRAEREALRQETERGTAFYEEFDALPEGKKKHFHTAIGDVADALGVVEENPRGRRLARSRRGKGADAVMESMKLSGVALQAYQDMVLGGLSPQAVADRLDISMKELTEALRQAQTRITAETEVLKEQLISRSALRTERVVGKIMRFLDKTEVEDALFGSRTRLLLSVMEMQNRLIELALPPTDKLGVQVNNFFSPTMNTSSQLTKEAGDIIYGTNNRARVPITDERMAEAFAIQRRQAEQLDELKLLVGGERIEGVDSAAED